MTLYRRTAGTPVKMQLRGRNGSGVSLPRIRTPNPPPVEPTGDTLAYSAEALGAGGWVTGMSISPDGQTRLGRTDTLGAWRWDSTGDRWAPALTSTSMPADGSGALDSGVGVQGIVAANDIAYIAYRDAIYKSTDRGLTWAVSLASGPKTAPNMGNQRWWNTRLAVDPAHTNRALYGTLNAGLYYTTNSGSTWTQVSSSTVPIGGDGATTPGKQTYGIPCVTIDTAGNWYAAPFGSGVYRSTDQGSTWAKISSDAQFVVVSGMAAGPNGDVMVTGHTSTDTATGSVVYRYRSGAWTAVTPPSARIWRTVAYDPINTGRVHVQGDGGYERVSLDYGDTWASPFHDMTSPATDIPWLAAANGGTQDFFFTTIGGLQFDPVVSRRLWMSQGIGVWYADLPTTPGTRLTWVSQSRGIEQLVVNDVICPPGGSPLAVSWDRAIFMVGETTAAPTTVVPAPPSTPITTAAALASVLTGGFPLTITYAWSVVSAPAGSTATPAAPSSLQTTFTPDVTGSYVLRLTATNSAGSTTTDVNLTAIAKVTGLILPGTTGNYVSTPATSSLDLTGSLTMQAKLSLSDWAPTTRIPIMGKYGGSSKSYALNLDSTGLLGNIATTTNGSAGAFNVPSGALSFPAGGVQWVRMFYDAPGRAITFSTSIDGTTWTVVKTVSTVASIPSGTATAVSTAPLTVGSTGNLSTYVNGRIYQAQLFDATGTLVAGFNAEPVTRTGTRLPASITGGAGLTWTPQGTGWDWS